VRAGGIQRVGGVDRGRGGPGIRDREPPCRRGSGRQALGEGWLTEWRWEESADTSPPLGLHNVYRRQAEDLP